MLAYLKATIDEKKQNTKKTDAYLASTAVHAIEPSGGSRDYA